MKKKEIIAKIKNIIEDYGSFSSGEIEVAGGTYSPCVSSLGNYVGLAEYFEIDKVEVNIYDPTGFSSDAMDSYEAQYEDLSKEVLSEILKLAEQYKILQEEEV